jgi:hypothetical protein
VHTEVKNSQLKFSKNLSCKELNMIRNSTEILDYKNLLQSQIEQASMLVFWLENEETFWEWMVIQDSSKGNYW